MNNCDASHRKCDTLSNLTIDEEIDSIEPNPSEEATVDQPLTKLPAVYGTGTFIIALTRAGTGLYPEAVECSHNTPTYFST
jgi:hypothetical protein